MLANNPVVGALSPKRLLVYCCYPENKLENNQTTIFGICNFIIKISLTISSSILIYFVGFLENEVKAQKEFISFSYAILPVIFRSCAGIFLYQNFKNYDQKNFF